ncbi:MAG TPA: hypothetical protein PKM59_07230 [Thermodesulfobacteriota bacterium]|nr:hypothetical protein [Thermodesulfobacteriota bacterium]HNU70384.1 hypothetical protein [Thermodesulfobacteriota bacterium]
MRSCIALGNEEITEERCLEAQKELPAKHCGACEHRRKQKRQKPRCSEPGCTRNVFSQGKCYRHRPDKAMQGKSIAQDLGKRENELAITPITVTVDFGGYPDLQKNLVSIAQENFRTNEMQILYFVALGTKLNQEMIEKQNGR